MPNKRGDGETNIQKYGYFNLKKKIKNIAPNGWRYGKCLPQILLND